MNRDDDSREPVGNVVSHLARALKADLREAEMMKLRALAVLGLMPSQYCL
jgi:hypothetical protein